MPTVEELEVKIALLGEKLSKSEDERGRLKEENTELKEKITNLEEKCKLVVEGNRQMREEIASLKTTVSAVVARSIRVKADSSSNHKNTKRNSAKPGRRNGHEGKSRRKPTHIDARIELDQPTCPKCGGHLSEDPTDEYSRVVGRQHCLWF